MVLFHKHPIFSFSYSSNSSFTDCVGTSSHNPLANADSTYTTCINDDGRITECEGTTMPGGRQTPSESATFISCIFKNLIDCGINGGAIYFADQNEGSLNVKDCFFERCEVKISQGNGNGGGAIYCRAASAVHISSSEFLSCLCNTTDNSDGGAIEMWEISSQPIISQCTFIFCQSDDDGGALSVWKSQAINKCICKDSVFLCGSCEDCGGGIIFWNNDDVLKCSNALFTDNEGLYGGSYANNIITQTQNYLLSFCFFMNNAAKYGNDVYFDYSLPDTPLLHCFSTATEKSVCYLDGHFIYNFDDWLPWM